MPKHNVKAVLEPRLYGASRQVTKANQQALFHNFSLWKKNAEDNGDFLCSMPSVGMVFDTATRSTILVVGNGPSAHENFDIIKDMQMSGIGIIAVDRVFNALNEAGIRPDITVTLDAQGEVVHFFKPEYAQNALVVLSPITHPDVVLKLRCSGARMLLNFPIAPGEFWPAIVESYGREYVGLRNGFVVTFTAADLAYCAGASRIVTIGNELSWKTREKNEYYAYMKQIMFKDRPAAVYSINAFIKAASTFKALPFAHKEVEWIDCSDGIVEGWKKKTLSEVLKDEKKASYRRARFNRADVQSDMPVAVSG